MSFRRTPNQGRRRAAGALDLARLRARNIYTSPEAPRPGVQLEGPPDHILPLITFGATYRYSRPLRFVGNVEIPPRPRAHFDRSGDEFRPQQQQQRQREQQREQRREQREQQRQRQRQQEGDAEPRLRSPSRSQRPRQGQFQPLPRPRRPPQQQLPLPRLPARTPPRARSQAQAQPLPQHQPTLPPAFISLLDEDDDDIVSLAPVPHKLSLLEFPREIRDHIYIHLLVLPRPVLVRHLWTVIFSPPGRRRAADRPTICTAILQTCTQIRAEAVEILYGHNEFEYLVRDVGPSLGPVALDEAHHHHRPEEDSSWGSSEEEGWSRRRLRARKRRCRNNTRADEEDEGEEGEDEYEPGQIWFGRFAHLFRRVAVTVEPNRTEPAYRDSLARAINAFAVRRHKKAHLHTLTINIEPTRIQPEDQDQGQARAAAHAYTHVDWLERQSPIIRALKRLPAHFIRINVGTRRLRGEEEGAGAGARFSIVVNKVSQAACRRAAHGERDDWEKDQLMLALRDERARQERDKLNNLAAQISERCRKIDTGAAGNEWYNEFASDGSNDGDDGGGDAPLSGLLVREGGTQSEDVGMGEPGGRDFSYNELNRILEKWKSGGDRAASRARSLSCVMSLGSP